MAKNTLEQYEDNWQSSMGGWVPGEAAFLRGKNIFTQLKDKTWMEYLLFAVTGREDPKTARLIEAIWVICISYPDPRLWNNRVAALAGSARSTGHLAMASALAVTEATLYGGRSAIGAPDFLYRAQQKLEQGVTLEQIIDAELHQFRKIYGYGRPVTDQDERIQPLMDYVERTGIAQGKYTELAFAVDRYFRNSRYPLQANIASVLTALLLDQGLGVRDIYHLYIFGFSAGFLPCYLDAQSKPEGALFPLSSSRINYRGAEARQWQADT